MREMQDAVKKNLHSGLLLERLLYLLKIDFRCDCQRMGV